MEAGGGGRLFSILGNINAVTRKDVFSLFRDDKVWSGKNLLNSKSSFKIADDNIRNLSDNFYDEDTGLVGFGNIRWFTNIYYGERPLLTGLHTMEWNLKNNQTLINKLNKKFGDSSKYPYCDNFTAIEVPFITAIPSDYDGVMCVPVTFFDVYNKEQFKVIGTDVGGLVPEEYRLPFQGDYTNIFVNHKKIYRRIFIRFRKTETD